MMYFDQGSAVEGGQDLDTAVGEIAEPAKVKIPQAAIENRMAEIVTAGNIEAAHLFSDEGLPIAQWASQQNVERDRIAEMAIMLHELRRMAGVMGGISRLREVTIEGENRRKIVFRFFQAFEQQVVLAVVVPPNKTYRQRTNELEKLIIGESQ
jgi:predicted regulator of Ras-like GTPase activity (Roadblock/LC7/MglB family)